MWRPPAAGGAHPHVGEPEKILLQRIREEKLPCVLCINKIDTVERKDDLLAVIAAYSEVYPDFDAIIPISARTGDGLEELLAQMQRYAVEGPQLFPDGMTTDSRINRSAPRSFGRKCCCVWIRRSPTARQWR